MRTYLAEVEIDGIVKSIYPIQDKTKTDARKRIKVQLRELRARRTD